MCPIALRKTRPHPRQRGVDERKFIELAHWLSRTLKVFLLGSSGITKYASPIVPITPPEAVLPNTLIVRIMRSFGRTEQEPTGGKALQNAAKPQQSSTPICEPQAHSEAASAAETFAMQRMTQLSSNRKIAPSVLAAVAIAFAVTAGLPNAQAQLGGVIQADYQASGFLTPAGMVPPEMYGRGNVGNVSQVGWLSGSACDAVPCDGGCDSGCSTGSCVGCIGGRACAGGGIFGQADNCDGGVREGGGLFGKSCLCGGCGLKGCGLCGGGGGLSNLRYICIFCRGAGCSACQLCNNHGASPLAFLGAFLPYNDAGLCAMRWYDLSVEAVFLDHSRGGASGNITSLGIDGERVLNSGSVNVDLATGGRLSAAMIFGAGSNLEVTYLGGHQWDGRSSVTNEDPQLFSFISDFGQTPLGGYDDTDRSLIQSIDVSSELHSGELNYRRRTVWPYCRFQGSWLVGLRYLRYNDRLVYSTAGEFDDATGGFPRFFSSNDRATNDLFGVQTGYDFWWNIRPGISMGVGAKGAWVNNNIDRRTILTANSINRTVELTDNTNKGAYLGDFEAKLVYRMSHSWTFRTAYYALVMDDIGFGGIDANTARNVVQGNSNIAQPTLQVDSLVIQGFSFGIEYMW